MMLSENILLIYQLMLIDYQFLNFGFGKFYKCLIELAKSGALKYFKCL